MAGRSSILVIVLAFTLLGSLLFFSSFPGKKGEVINYPANVSTTPKASALFFDGKGRQT